MKNSNTQVSLSLIWRVLHTNTFNFLEIPKIFLYSSLFFLNKWKFALTLRKNLESQKQENQNEKLKNVEIRSFLKREKKQKTFCIICLCQLKQWCCFMLNKTHFMYIFSFELRVGRKIVVFELKLRSIFFGWWERI